MAYNYHWQKKRAFTLIEVIIVVAIVSILLPSLFAIIFTLLRLQLQMTQLMRVKEVGDYVSNNIMNTVRTNAIAVDEECLFSEPLIANKFTRQADQSFLTFRDKNDTCFGYLVRSDGQLASISATLGGPDYETPLVATDVDSETPLTIIRPTFVKVNDRLAHLKFTVHYEPTAAYLRPQELKYQFYIYLRH